MIEVLSDEAIKRMGESMKEEIISEEIQQEEKPFVFPFQYIEFREAQPHFDLC